MTVGCQLSKLAGVGDAVRHAATSIVGSTAADLVDLAVTEICSNIIRHGHAGDPAHEFLVTIRSGGDAIEVVIADVGPPFDMTQPVMPSVDVELDALAEGGYGMALAAATMDVFEQRRVGGTNVTRLVKRRP
jgi:serine/threonine-protein kinase RsbW